MVYVTEILKRTKGTLSDRHQAWPDWTAIPRRAVVSQIPFEEVTVQTHTAGHYGKGAFGVDSSGSNSSGQT